MGPSKDLSWAMALQLGLPNEIHTSNLSWSHSWCLLISYWDCTIQIWECSVNFPSNQYLQKKHHILYCLVLSYNFETNIYCLYFAIQKQVEDFYMCLKTGFPIPWQVQ